MQRKGKISDMDNQGWSHVGASGADWNWAAGSEWGTAAEAVPGCPPAASFWPPPVEAATPPWMAAAQMDGALPRGLLLEEEQQ